MTDRCCKSLLNFSRPKDIFDLIILTCMQSRAKTGAVLPEIERSTLGRIIVINTFLGRTGGILAIASATLLATFAIAIGLKSTAQAYQNLGVALFKLGRQAESLRAFERAILAYGLDPDG